MRSHVVKNGTSAPLIVLLGSAMAIPLSPIADASGEDPDILCIVLDDIGIDQAGFPPFGWNASPTSPAMPVFEAIAAGGVSFTNFWAMPECSPSRASMLTGRYPQRTGVVTPIVDPMLPIVQLNPAEITISKVLGDQYRTAMVGKYHVTGGPDNSPTGHGYGSPATTAGLDYYAGYWQLPPVIDPTVGGQVATENGYPCGAPTTGVPGAACFPDGTCVEGLLPFEAKAMGGQPLLDSTGVLAESCSEGNCSSIDFTRTDAYYAWPEVTTFADGSYTAPSTPMRGNLTEHIQEASLDWIEHGGEEPWLCYVTYSMSHTPIQTPPPSLTGDSDIDYDCSLDGTSVQYRQVFKLMCEAVDRSIGELLVDLDLGWYDKEGDFQLRDPAETNTLIVVFGDNGSFAPTVLLPFDPALAKATVYQTGVWTPCVVAGPMVVDPGRTVAKMVNVVDLFGLFADVAGIDYEAVVEKMAPGRQLDCQPMLPYLEHVDAPGQRAYDFAMTRQGVFPEGETGPCLVGATIQDYLMGGSGAEALCLANLGCWLGGSDEAPYRIAEYCDLYGSSFTCGNTTYVVLAPGSEVADDEVIPNPPQRFSYAVRSEHFKLITIGYPECLPEDQQCVIQFYRLPTPEPPLQPKLDEPGGATEIDISDPDSLDPPIRAAFEALKQVMYDLIVSEWYCPGDGNKDFRVDGEDLTGLLASWGEMSFYDINLDGTTDGVDLGMLLGYWNHQCVGQVNEEAQYVPPCLE